MANEVTWIIENHLISNKYVGTLEMSDFLTVAEMNVALMAGISNPIHVMADLTELDGIHSEFGHLPELVSISRKFMSQSNLGSIVAYGTDNKLVKFLGTMIMQLNKTQWHVSPNFDEAMRYLSHIDSSLTPELETLRSSIPND